MRPDPGARARLDVIAMVRSRGAGLDPADLEPEHVARLARCRARSADLSAAFDLPLGVVRILIADLRERGLVDVDQLRPERVPDAKVLGR